MSRCGAKCSSRVARSGRSPPTWRPSATAPRFRIRIRSGYLTGAVAPPLGRATATDIAEAVRIGPFVMPRFSKSQISDRQLNSIIRYLLYARHPNDAGGWSLNHVGPVPEGLVTWLIAAVLLVATCLLIGTRLKKS